MNTVGVEARADSDRLTLLEALVHELRQPLSAIESTAYYLGMVLPRGERRAQEQTSRLQRLTEQAGWILSCALQLADTSPLSPQPLDLEKLIAQTLASQYIEAASPSPREGDSPRLDLAGDLPPVHLDPGRARGLLENLFAMMRRAADPGRPLQVRTTCAPDLPLYVQLELSIDLLPDVSGVGSEACLGAGAAMGVESARRIVEAHGGTFGIDFDASGVRVRILLPESLRCGALSQSGR